MGGEDTEVLLASLVSLLEPSVPEQADLLNALVDCNGNVEDAARLLRTSIQGQVIPPKTKKRKRDVPGLDQWLSPRASSSGSSRPVKRTISPARYVELATAGPSRLIQGKSPDRQTKPPSKAMTKESKSHHTSSLKLSVSESPAAEPVNLMSVLRAPSPEKRGIPRNPPLTLSNPTMVAEHSPCTLHYSTLPPKLACDLYYTMLDAAQNWSRNKWWLFDRLVESPHRTSFFARVEGMNVEGDPGDAWKEAAQFWYNGRKTEPPMPFPEEMEEACRYIETVVNDELGKRPRYPLEWGGSSGSDGYAWRANVAAANCYEGAKEGVGFHSDQLTYLGPYPTIASLSLGTTRMFRLREVIPASETNERQARTFNIPLPHNSLIIMHASTQERFKHCIPPQHAIDVFRPPFPRHSRSNGTNKSNYGDDIPSSNCRINITFRFYRPDFAPSTTPRCKCGHPCVLRPDMKGRVDQQDIEAKGGSVGGVENDTSGRDQGEKLTGENKHHVRYWWACYAGAQNEGKGCGMWKVMDIEAEGKGPFVGAVSEVAQAHTQHQKQRNKRDLLRPHRPHNLGGQYSINIVVSKSEPAYYEVAAVVSMGQRIRLERRKGGGGKGGVGKGGHSGSKGGSSSSATKHGASKVFTSSRGSKSTYLTSAKGNASPYSDGGGKTITLASGSSFSGRLAGGGSRNSVYGTSHFGSGYPYGGYGSYVSSRPLPYYYYPVSVSNGYYGGDEYLTSDRPGGNLTVAIVQPSFNTSSVTYRLVGDSDSVIAVFDALVANCSVANASSAIASFSPSNNSWPVPEQIIQYYRASSFALSLDGYNNTATLLSNAPSSNDSSPAQVADTSLPSGLNTTFLECVNSTTGASVPLVDASGKNKFSGAEIFGLVLAGIFGLFLLCCFFFCCCDCRTSRKKKQKQQEERYNFRNVPSIQVLDSSDFSRSRPQYYPRPTSVDERTLTEFPLSARDRWSDASTFDNGKGIQGEKSNEQPSHIHADSKPSWLMKLPIVGKRFGYKSVKHQSTSSVELPLAKAHHTKSGSETPSPCPSPYLSPSRTPSPYMATFPLVHTDGRKSPA